MNHKLLLSFVAGVVVASGVAYFVGHRTVPTGSTVPVASQAPVVASPPAPAATASEAPPHVSPDLPVKSAPEVKSAPPRPAPAAKSTPKAEPPVVSAQTDQITPEPTSAKVAPPPAAEPPAKPAPTQEAVSIYPPSAEKKPATQPVESRILRPDASNAMRPPVVVPRTPNTVTIPPGTALSVRLGEGLSTDRNVTGDEFTGTLNEPLVVNDLVIAERGARVEGRVVESEKAGRVRGLAHMSIDLTHLHTSDGQNIAIRTSTFAKDGPESKKEDAAKVGIGAAIGAVIGGIAGGGKGAAIGAAAGGAAGGGTVAATRGKPAVLPVETPLHFMIQEPITLTERLHD